MSQDPHAHASTPTQLEHYPAGRIGITRGVLGLVLLTILASIMQGSFVVSASSWGRVWPSMNSTKLDLPPMTLPPAAPASK